MKYEIVERKIRGEKVGKRERERERERERRGGERDEYNTKRMYKK